MHLSLGNPHSVVGVDEVARRRPARCSVARSRRSTSRSSSRARKPTAITMRVHERGAGITEACGTGACAAAFAGPVVGARRRRCRPKSSCTWTAARPASASTPRAGRVSLTGPATLVATVVDRPVDLDRPWTHESHDHAVRRSTRRNADRPDDPGADRARRASPRPRDTDDDIEASLDELALLVDTAGADEVGRMVQRRDSPDHTWYIGKGKAEELQAAVPRRRRRHRRVRQRARPGAAVQPREAARPHGDRPHRGDPRHLRPERPHPRGQGAGRAGPAPLPPAAAAARSQGQACRSSAVASAPASVAARRSSRSTDGASCGGSTSSRPSSSELAETRSLQRKGRGRSGLAAVAIVGYTNAGKSTLLNRLTDAGVLVENRLFATLDPTTRRLALPGGEPVLLTDTVGFVSRLPHGLVEAFKSTLEVAAQADYLVHVVDSSARRPGRRRSTPS